MGMKKAHLSQLDSLTCPKRPQQGTDWEAEEGLWTPRIAANYCGFQSPVTILRAFRDRRLPGYKLGLRAVRFDPKDVKAWIAAARVGEKEAA